MDSWRLTTIAMQKTRSRTSTGRILTEAGFGLSIPTRTLELTGEAAAPAGAAGSLTRIGAAGDTDFFLQFFLLQFCRRVSDGKFRRTNYRVVVKNISSQTSWQVERHNILYCKILSNIFLFPSYHIDIGLLL